MKHLRHLVISPAFYLLVILFAFCTMGCSDDGCSVEDWEGTYIGTKTCGNDVSTDYSFVVSNMSPIGQPETMTNTLLMDNIPIIVEDCVVVGGSATSTIGQTTYVGMLEGKELEVTVTSATGSCTWIATRQ